MCRILTVEGARTEEFITVFEQLGVSLEFITSKHGLPKVAQADGLLLMGGRDISPKLYGQTSGLYTQTSDPYRDGLELALTQEALYHRVPVLGICRGMQLLTAAAGGTLTQHLNAEQLATHRAQPHRLKWVRGKLGNLMPRLEVNSFHHQAVAKVPRGFEVVAEAPDGVIEAIYRPGALGLQWHLESLCLEDDRWLELFGWFLDGLRPFAHRRY